MQRPSWRPTLGAILVIASPPLLSAQDRPPLEGPLTQLVLTLSDDDSFDDAEFIVSYRPDYSGSPLPAAIGDHVLAVLDSGASTHVISFPDSVDLGIDHAFRTTNTTPVGGAGGSIDIDISVPLGLFVHGAQDLTPAGLAQTGLLVGEANCPVGVNTEANFLAGSTLPSVIGMPILAFYPVEVKNSDLLDLSRDGERIRTASSTFYKGADNPLLPTYPHKIPLEFVPTDSSPVLWIFDFTGTGFTPVTPAIAGSGALLQTASEALRFTEGETDRSAHLIVDTAAQATLISENVAIDLGLNLASPDFEIEVQGIGGTETAPGFYIDEFYIPTGMTGGLTWQQVPVVVRNITGPEGTTIAGILGSNLLGNRDFLLNGATTSPYLEVSTTTVPFAPEVTAIRRSTGGLVEVDWFCHPAPGVIQLEMSRDPATGPAGWTTVATAELATIAGTISVDTPATAAFFRIRASN